MKDLAGRLQMIQDLYDSGMLCKCPHGFIQTDIGLEARVFHTPDCEGKPRILKLLDLE